MNEMYKKIIYFLKSNLKNLEAIIIFGSFANNYANTDSDIDIAFLCRSEVSNIKRWKLQEELASLLNRNVDLVNLQTASDVFRFQIVSNGIVIYALDKKSLEPRLDKIYAFYLQLNDDRKAILNDIKNGSYYAR
jgi:predicted nucleotidyltransferase